MRKKTSPSRLPVCKGGYTKLVGGLTELLEEARRAVARSVNAILTATYWEIGRQIVEFEQEGQQRATYGKQLLERLAKDLTERFGRGFGYSNLNLIRQFYLTYQDRRPILQSPIGESRQGTAQGVTEDSAVPAANPVHQSSTRGFVLSWTHYVRLLPLDDPDILRCEIEEEWQRLEARVR